MDHQSILAPSTDSPPQGVSAATHTIHEAVQLAVASTVNLAREPAAYFSGLTRDIAEAGAQLAACRSPFDVLALQQSYTMARGKAWLDSAYRCFERCVTDEDALQPTPGRLVLPD
jgi:hypothetical protein